MNSIITLNRLAELIARVSGTKISETEAYLKAFMEAAKEAIAIGETLSIKGIGTFAVEEMRGERKIFFQPDEELAKAVNDPFSMFEPEELAPGASIESLDMDIIIDEIAPAAMPNPQSAATEPTPATTPKPMQDVPEPTPMADVEPKQTAGPEIEPLPEPLPEPDPAPAPEIEPAPTEEIAPKPESESTIETGTESAIEPEPTTDTAPEPKANVVAPQPKADAEPEDEPRANLAAAYAPAQPQIEENAYEPYLDDEYEGHGKFPVFWTTWALIIGLLIGLAIGFFAHDPIMELLEPSLGEQEKEIVDEDMTATDDTTLELADGLSLASDESAQPAAESTEPVAEPAKQEAEADVYDVITERVFLTHLAQKHYHKKDYWVYIYLENKDIIGNPNNIKVGTRVKIPPLSKYAKHASEDENLREAKQLAQQLLK